MVECPVCDKDIDNELDYFEVDGFESDEKFECPYCGAKLIVGRTCEYYAVIDEDDL